ncbi:MAG: hypothetical protein K6B69_10975, partial [Lachnospiraceae bacterium]|nr:hypothetical protein [Lachnospiraceae bacterium]
LKSPILRRFSLGWQKPFDGVYIAFAFAKNYVRICIIFQLNVAMGFGFLGIENQQEIRLKHEKNNKTDAFYTDFFFAAYGSVVSSKQDYE